MFSSAIQKLSKLSICQQINDNDISFISNVIELSCEINGLCCDRWAHSRRPSPIKIPLTIENLESWAIQAIVSLIVDKTEPRASIGDPIFFFYPF